jgi:hypothetical protein
MRRAAALPALLAAAVLAADPPPRDKETGDKPADGLVPVGSIRGVLRDTGGSSGHLVVRVSIPYLEANAAAQQSYAQRQQQLLQRQQQILRNPDPRQRYQQMQQLVRDAQGLMAQQKDLFHVRQKQQDVELRVPDEVKVRTARLPQAFDDKGNPRRYTPKELQELRGTDNLPGYAAAPADLQVGQTVLVRVAVRRKGAAPKSPDKDAPQESQKDKPPAPPPDEGKPLAVVIVIADGVK